MQIPWLSSPVLLHSSRDPGMCMMTAEQCAYKQRYWVNWYQADRRYGLPTVALFLAAIILAGAGHLLSAYVPLRLRRARGWSRAVACTRLAGYTHVRVWPSHAIRTLCLGAVGLIFFLSMMLGPRPYYWPNTHTLSYGNSPPIATRSGYMSLACLPFILALGSKASLVTAVTGLSHERLNVWHAWASWAMFVLALVHTFPFVVYRSWKGDIAAAWNDGGTWVSGVVALVFQFWLTFFSVPWLRARAYELFKSAHFLAAACFVVFLFLHCGGTLSSWDYFIASGVLYSLTFFYSVLRTLFEHGLRCRARCELLSDQLLRISVDTTAPATAAAWLPGQHVFLRFLALGPHALTAHPFTIASVPRPADTTNRMVFYVAPRAGTTARLAALARRDPLASIPVLIDGPYGGLPTRWFVGFDRRLVVAGGAGVGLTLALVEHQLRAAGPGALLRVVLATRDPLVRQWYLAALEDIFAASPVDEKPRIAIEIYETATSSATSSNSDQDEPKLPKPLSGYTVDFFQDRPDLPAIVGEQVAQPGLSVGISTCGPSSMVRDVEAVAAAVQLRIARGDEGVAREVWYHAESFSF